jgi:cytochrome P450
MKAGQPMSSTAPTDTGRLPTAGWYGVVPDDPDYLDDPYPYFRKLRETQPVNVTPENHCRLTRYEDVTRLLRGAKTGVRTAEGILPGQTPEAAAAEPPPFMLMQDPPVHTRLRKLVSKAFTPRAVESWRPRIEAIADRQLDSVASQGRMDVVADLALPVPATLICELLGVPVEDRDRFTTWTTDATHGLATTRREMPAEIVARVEAARIGLAGYFNTLIEARRGTPSDDLLSVLIAAEEDGDKLSPGELLVQSIGLLIAGFETTIGLIGNGVTTLIQNPQELAKLRAEPTLIESAVEECLRYSGPITMTIRILHEDTEFGGFLLPKDMEMFGVLAAANRDPEHFDDPERFDVTRYAQTPAPPPQLSFGGGVHFCLGAHLARLETQIAIGKLVERFDNLELISARTKWGRSLFRVPAEVPVRFS